eukprot:Gb_23956 [translate_table: standard]
MEHRWVGQLTESWTRCLLGRVQASFSETKCRGEVADGWSRGVLNVQPELDVERTIKARDSASMSPCGIPDRPSMRQSDRGPVNRQDPRRQEGGQRQSVRSEEPTSVGQGDCTDDQPVCRETLSVMSWIADRCLRASSVEVEKSTTVGTDRRWSKNPLGFACPVQKPGSSIRFENPLGQVQELCYVAFYTFLWCKLLVSCKTVAFNRAQGLGDALKTMLEAAGPMLEQYDPETILSLTRFTEQIPSVMNQITQGTSEFKPTPSENRETIKASYKVPITLLVKFSVDTIDETHLIENVLRARIDAIGGSLTKVVLNGTHITPCGQAKGIFLPFPSGVYRNHQGPRRWSTRPLANWQKMHIPFPSRVLLAGQGIRKLQAYFFPSLVELIVLARNGVGVVLLRHISL